MQIIIKSEDGKTFSTIQECIDYENQCRREKEIAFQKKIKEEIDELDEKIWKTFYPNWEEDNACSKKCSYLNLSVCYINEDIKAILYENPSAEEKIKTIIKEAEDGEYILDKYIDFEKIKNEVYIRKNFADALRSVKKGTELSSKLNYSFSSKDIKELAKLHKSNKFRKKIENLLEDCNFHYECGKFMDKDYDEFLNIEENKE